MTSHRQQRISELLREELSLLIIAELEDPRFADALVTVTDVEVSPDLQNAHVFIDHALDVEDERHLLDALRHAEPFLRRALLEHLDLRVIPHLTFRIDDTARHARRIDALLDEIAAQPSSAPAEEHSQIEDDLNPAS